MTSELRAVFSCPNWLLAPSARSTQLVGEKGERGRPGHSARTHKLPSLNEKGRSSCSRRVDQPGGNCEADDTTANYQVVDTG